MINIQQIAETATYFELIPLVSNGKTPLIDKWQDEEARKAYPWFMHNGNVGGVVGTDNMVLDIDPRNGGAESYKQLLTDHPYLERFPPCVYTAGQGGHVYFKLPSSHGRRIRKQLKDYPGLDWLCGNMYVVLPGSTNGAGAWRWADQPITILPEFPRNILEQLFKEDTPASDGLPEPSGLWGVLTADDLGRLLKGLDVTRFDNNDAWFELMGSCHHATAGEGKEEFLHWSSSDPAYLDHLAANESRWESLSAEGPGARPLTARSLVRLFNPAPKWLMTKLAYHSAADLFEALPEEDKNRKDVSPDENRTALKEWRQKIEDEGDECILEDVIWKQIAMDSRLTAPSREKLAKKISKKTGATVRSLKDTLPKKIEQADSEGLDNEQAPLSVAEGVITKFGGEDKLVYQAGDFWAFNKKHWEMIPGEKTEHLINKTTREMGGGHLLGGPFISSVSKVLRTYLDPKPMGYWNPKSAAVRINIPSGMLELQDSGAWKLLGHDKGHRMNYILPTEPKEMPTPYFDKYMKDCLDGDEQTIRTILAAMVYTATSKKQWWKKCFFLKGEGDSGKSVWLDVMEAFTGDDLRTSLSLQDLSSEYKLADLRGKLLNVSGELDSSRVNTETFKKVIAGDSINSNRKFQGAIDFRNNAIFWFAGNNWPNLRDSSSASLNRITLINFPNVISKHEIDEMMPEKIKRELPGIFHRALSIFAEEYTKDAGMTVRETPRASLSAFREFQFQNQPIRLWAEERTELDKAAFTTSGEFYQDYRTWCANTGHNAMNESSFRQRVSKALGMKSTRDEGRDGKRGYNGVRVIKIF